MTRGLGDGVFQEMKQYDQESGTQYDQGKMECFTGDETI